MMKGRSGTVALLLVLGVLVLIPSAWAGPANNGGLPSIQVLSNQANLVSGGDALVQVVLPARVDPSTVTRLGRRPRRHLGLLRPPGRTLPGVVTGLADGANDVMAPRCGTARPSI